MSVRNQIMDALGTALATILQANDYATDAGANVYEWREKLAVDRLPAIIYRDTVGVVDYEDCPMGKQDNLLTVEVEAAAAGETSLADARAMLSDIAKCLHANRRFGGLSRWAGAEKAEIICDHAEQIVTGVKVTARIEYRTDQGII